MTDMPPATLPDPCCDQGAALVATIAGDLAGPDGDIVPTMAAMIDYGIHQVDDHGNTGAPVDGCPNCVEWRAVLEGRPLDTSRLLDREAAQHYVLHQVMDPLRARHAASRVATLGNHGGNGN